MKSMWFAVLLLSACKSKDAPLSEAKPSDPTFSDVKSSEKPSQAKPIEDPRATAVKPTWPGPTDADNARAAEFAKQRIHTLTLVDRDVQIDVPYGILAGKTEGGRTLVSFPEGKPFVQLYGTDTDSGVTFEEIKNVIDDGDVVLERLAEEKHATGYVLYKRVDSARMKKQTWQVDVTKKIDHTFWSCSVMAPSRIEGDLALAACRSLAKATMVPTATAPTATATPTAAKPDAAKPAKPAAPAKPSGPAAPAPAGQAFE